jgi:non-specific serine/threonine protein kinase
VAAWVSLLQGDGPAAQRRLAECDQLCAELGDGETAAFSRSLRGTAELFAGDLPAAIDSFDAARLVFQASRQVEGLLWALFQLAISLSHHGDSERADAICRESLALSEATGELLCRSYTLWVLGFNTWRHRDAPAAAAALTRQGLAIQRDFHDPIGAALMIQLLAWTAASVADFEEAARLLGAADSILADTGTTIRAFGPQLASHHAECERRIRTGLDDNAFRAARDAGRCSSVAQAIASALDEHSSKAPARNGTDALPVLTRRELEIANLIAKGMTNRDIAASLIISARTVDGHVERMLAKLGFGSRTQVAAYIASRPL